jgi:hypothetical protein
MNTVGMPKRDPAEKATLLSLAVVFYIYKMPEGLIVIGEDEKRIGVLLQEFVYCRPFGAFV